MDDEPYTTQQTTSWRASRRSTSPHQAAYAIERAKVLFGCYRRGEANDPDAYVAAVAAVLSRYETDLIREVTDPNTGIQTTEKYMSFMPNAGELKVYCESVATRHERLDRLGSLPPPQLRLPPPPPRPGDLARVLVPASNPRYEHYFEWAKTADARLWRFDDKRPGIWVAWNVVEQRHTMVSSSPRDFTRSLALSPTALREMAQRDAVREQPHKPEEMRS